MAKFVRIQTCEQGNTHDELINIEDISRITLGANILSLRTPYGNGEHRHSITQESVDKLLKVLNIVGEGEQMARIMLKNPKMVKEQDIVFNQNSNYQKQKKQEKKNPIFKRNKPKK